MSKVVKIEVTSDYMRSFHSLTNYQSNKRVNKISVQV